MKPLFTISAASLTALFIAQACVTELGSWSVADINDDGIMVGRLTDENRRPRAVVRLPNGDLRELPTFPGDSDSEAVSVTNTGVVIGHGTSPVGRHPLVWGPGSIRSLGQLDGRDTRVLAANNAEVVVGIAYEPTRAWIYDPSVGHIEELPVPDATVSSEATAINDKGEIVGTVGFLTGSRPIKWAPKTHAFSYLPVLGFPTTIGLTGINDSGAIVGSYNGRPVVWKSSSAQPTFLPTGPWSHGRALAINDAGVVIGKVQIDPSTPDAGFGGIYMGKAALWTVEGELVDLDPDGFVAPSIASEAVAINASGAVVGNRNRTPENPGGRATRFR
jgi:uncharacterized membrane protein